MIWRERISQKRWKKRETVLRKLRLMLY